jgi:hypothetical protein
MKMRNRWTDVVFILNVVFYSGGRVRMKTRQNVVFALNVVFIQEAVFG